MRLLIAGERKGDIARIFGISPVYLSQLMKDPLFRAEFEKLEGEVRKRLIEQTAGYDTSDPVRKEIEREKLNAIRTIADLMKSSRSEQVKHLSARDILDRAGYIPPKRQEIKGELQIEVDATIERLKQAWNEAEFCTDTEAEGEGEE